MVSVSSLTPLYSEVLPRQIQSLFRKGSILSTIGALLVQVCLKQSSLGLNPPITSIEQNLAQKVIRFEIRWVARVVDRVKQLLNSEFPIANFFNLPSAQTIEVV